MIEVHGTIEKIVGERRLIGGVEFSINRQIPSIARVHLTPLQKAMRTPTHPVLTPGVTTAPTLGNRIPWLPQRVLT